MCLNYDESALPADVTEDELLVALWDADLSEWVTLGNITRDTVNNRICGETTHITPFAIMTAPPVEEEEAVPEPEPTPPLTPTPEPEPTPAAFTVSDVSVSPASVDAAETVTISATIANTGEESGTYTVTLKVNGVVASTREVTLAGGASQKVIFTHSEYMAGSYIVDVNGETATFTVKKVEVAPPEEEEEEEVEEVPAPAGQNRWWIVALISAAAVLGAGLILVMRRMGG